MHGFPSRRAGALPAAYHIAQSSNIFRYAPLSHHDNQSEILASKCPRYFLTSPNPVAQSLTNRAQHFPHSLQVMTGLLRLASRLSGSDVGQESHKMRPNPHQPLAFPNRLSHSTGSFRQATLGRQPAPNPGNWAFRRPNPRPAGVPPSGYPFALWRHCR